MAKIIYDGQEKEVADNSALREPCKDMGMLFGCENGICGTCLSKVDSGMENLPPKNDAEEQFGLEQGMRLMCQCSIKKGIVKITQL